jgi:uncharacterized protein YcbK (DUF882 family)
MTQDEATELALDAFKYEMKAAETITELFGDYDEEMAKEAMQEAFVALMENVDSEERANSVATVMETFAKQLESEEMMNTVIEVAKRSEHLEVQG